METPVLVKSPKLSNSEPGQYLDGRRLEIPSAESLDVWAVRFVATSLWNTGSFTVTKARSSLVPRWVTVNIKCCKLACVGGVIDNNSELKIGELCSIPVGFITLIYAQILLGNVSLYHFLSPAIGKSLSPQNS